MAQAHPEPASPLHETIGLIKKVIAVVDDEHATEHDVVTAFGRVTVCICLST